MKKIFSNIQETGLLLILYFGPDKSGENEEITKEINTILRRIEKFISETIDDLKMLSGTIRSYLKNEWDRAKNNKD